jgi:hypothetical protein
MSRELQTTYRKNDLKLFKTYQMNTKTVKASCIIVLEGRPEKITYVTDVSSTLKQRDIRLVVRKRIREKNNCSNKDIMHLNLSMLVTKKIRIR